MWLVEQGEDDDSARVAAYLAGHPPSRKTVFMDVWTAEVDEQVARYRSEGYHLSCVADYLLARQERCIGITGSAGKTSTAWRVQELLGSRAVSSQARAGNLWPTGELLVRGKDELMVLELTSSHLPFCHHSPHIAAITCLWPDHVELHGSYAAYKAAKARLFQFQGPGDYAVLPRHDPEAASLADGSPAQKVWYDDDCALAIVEIVLQLRKPPHRLASRGDLVDDTLAATPRKASRGLHPGVNLVAGGMTHSRGRRVHASPEEQPALERWMAAIREQAASVHLFGTAGEWMLGQLPGAVLCSSLEEALERAPRPVLVAPGFPMEQSDRLKVAACSR